MAHTSAIVGCQTGYQSWPSSLDLIQTSILAWMPNLTDLAQVLRAGDITIQLLR